MLCKGWINVYRSGFFHTAGKPGAYDRHPGDIYATEDDAREDISPASHYVATVPIQWEEEVVPPVNPRLNDEGYWSGSPDPLDPDNFWIDDTTGETVNAITGRRFHA